MKIWVQFAQKTYHQIEKGLRLGLDQNQNPKTGLYMQVVGRAEPHNRTVLHPDQDRVVSIRENMRMQVSPATLGKQMFVWLALLMCLNYHLSFLRQTTFTQ